MMQNGDCQVRCRLTAWPLFLMSLLLARLARTLTQRWKRGASAALAVIVLLGAAAGAGGEAADDFSIPGTESQRALDLFKAHTPAFAGADSTLVFSVEDGTLGQADRRQAIEGAQGFRPSSARA